MNRQAFTDVQKRSPFLAASADVSSPVWSFSMTASLVSTSIRPISSSSRGHALFF